ncbi:hypothetical protein [Thiohalomonas denitrificans]|uniref:hypothetical protein n=1 Tax=Thiohalomonas denitrificans TaxID=415747 RepID=UPI0026EB45D4|nr:hypothetical protein [Thiohalomonas denitrificans]
MLTLGTKGSMNWIVTICTVAIATLSLNAAAQSRHAYPVPFPVDNGFQPSEFSLLVREYEYGMSLDAFYATTTTPEERLLSVILKALGSADIEKLLGLVPEKLNTAETKGFLDSGFGLWQRLGDKKVEKRVALSDGELFVLSAKLGEKTLNPVFDIRQTTSGKLYYIPKGLESAEYQLLDKWLSQYQRSPHRYGSSAAVGLGPAAVKFPLSGRVGQENTKGVCIGIPEVVIGADLGGHPAFALYQRAVSALKSGDFENFRALHSAKSKVWVESLPKTGVDATRWIRDVVGREVLGYLGGRDHGILYVSSTESWEDAAIYYVGSIDGDLKFINSGTIPLFESLFRSPSFIEAATHRDGLGLSGNCN